MLTSSGRYRRFLITLMVGVLLTSILPAQSGPGGGARGGSPRGTDNAGGSASSTGPVATATIEERSHGITVVGRLEPRTRIEHRAPSAGYVETVLVTEGQRISAGDQLLRIRRRDDLLELYQPVPLTARVSGLVAQVHVSSESEVSVGEVSVTIIGTDGYVLHAAVSDKDAFRVGVGRSVTGRTTDGIEIAGILETRSQEPDYETGLFELTFRFPDSPRVRIGEFILISLPVDRIEGVFVLRDAVVRRYGSFFLWAVSEDNTLVAQEVTVGAAFDDEVVIEEGLLPGMRYLRTLSGREREGDPTVPVPSARGNGDGNGDGA